MKVVVMVYSLSPVWLLQPHGLYLQGSSVLEISQASILEWAAISFSITGV